MTGKILKEPFDAHAELTSPFIRSLGPEASVNGLEKQDWETSRFQCEHPERINSSPLCQPLALHASCSVPQVARKPTFMPALLFYGVQDMHA